MKQEPRSHGNTAHIRYHQTRGSDAVHPAQPQPKRQPHHHLPSRTFHDCIDADPVFAEAVEEVEADSIGVAEDFASVMNLVREFQRRQREDKEFMRGYGEWKQLSDEKREASLREEEHITFRDPDLPGDGTLAEENPGNRVPFVPSEIPATNPPNLQTFNLLTFNT